MRKAFSTHSNRFILVFLLSAFGFFGQLTAQDFTIGSGTSSSNSNSYDVPLQDRYATGRSQFLYLASELQAAGMTIGTITTVKFNVTTVNDANNKNEGLLIKVGATNATALVTNQWESFLGAPGQTTPMDHTPVVGVNVFPLTTSFVWNGVDNILVEVCTSTPTTSVDRTLSPIMPLTGTPVRLAHGNVANSGVGCDLSSSGSATSSLRADITFSLTKFADCTGTPVAGTVNSSSSFTCGSDVFLLSLSGSTQASALVYQWQSSLNGTTWTNIVGATSANLNTSQLVSTYYRCIVTCTPSAISDTSNALLVNATPAVSGTYTIDNSIPASTPTIFKTFGEAIEKIKCGINGPIVFNVVNNATPYNEQVVVPEIPGASATNTVTFKGNGASLNFLSTLSSERAGIRLDGADHIIFDSLTINALGSTTSQYGWGFHLTNNADSNIIRNCTIVMADNLTSSNYAGIVMSGSNTSSTFNPSFCDGNVVDRNTILGGQLGVSIIGDALNACSRNSITNNTIKNFYQYAVYVGYTAYMQIEGNNISRPNRTATGAGYGIYVTSTTLLANISRNKIHSFFDSHPTFTGSFYGIYMNGADADPGLENTVANNAIYNIRGNGVLYGIYNNSSNAGNYYYNTISFDDNTSASVAATYGYYTTSYTASVEFRNNVISITRSGSGLKFHFYMNDDRAALYTVNHNDYFSTLNNVTIKQGYYKGNEIASLAEWRTATGFDANSLDVDPIFKDAAGGDLTPTSGAFDNKGTPLSVTNDLNNSTRSATTPDMGAIEFSLPSCNTNFLAGDAFSNVGNSTCQGKTVELNLKNNDIGSGMTYQWQSATTLGGPWTSISAPLLAPPYRFTIGNSDLYYRASVACNGGTPNFSTPVQIVIGGYFPAGAYTIDKTQPTDPAGTKNFNSFTEAVNALSCGIAGPVVFNVTPNTYTEQIKITEIPNTSSINTITFQSQNGDPASAILSFGAVDANKNYTVQMDSARNITFKNLTIAATNQTNGRVFDLMNTASYDSIVNCVINAPVPLTNGYNSTNTAGVHAATSFKGENIVIQGNTFKNGSKGIYMVGFSNTFFTRNNTIEGNSFQNVYHLAIYTQNTSSIKINRNVIPMNTPYFTTSFNQGVMGIYMNNCDSAVEVIGNNISLTNNTGYVYGIFILGIHATENGRSKFMNNKIVANQGLTSHTVGIKNANNSNDKPQYADFINNEISVSSTVAGTSNSIYGSALVSNNARNTNYYNNSLLNLSPAAGFYNATFWLDHQFTQSGGFCNIFNNIITNKGGGPAMYINYTAKHVKMDYNMLYAAGSLLVKRGPPSPNVADKNFTSLEAWRQEYGTDINSIVYEPAFTSNSNLQPDAANAGSWAMQGRGTQLEGNNTDFNGNPRSTTLTGGVPDLGAYEFMPSVAPPVLIATPAAPAAGTTQKFSMGTDTVTSISWAPGAPVPASIELKRYSGVLPPGMPAAEKTMYYYVDADVTGSGPFKYNIVQNFIEPWLNTLPVKSLIKLGKTDAANVWAAGANSVIDSLNNVMSDTMLTFMDKFTGMTNGIIPVQPVIVTSRDSTNKGTRFWSPYAFDRNMLQSNAQEQRFLLASDVATEATVTVTGTPYRKTYQIPAGGVVVTDDIPNSGVYDARQVIEGLSHRGILIESLAPIAAASHRTSGAYTAINNKPVLSWLLPTGTYSKEYTTLGARQFSGYPSPTMGTSWVSVVADRDNTVVEITPSGVTQGGMQAGVPFRVTMNRGDVYQILGGFLRFLDRDITGGSDNSYESSDLTGTTVVSVPNSAGVCQPIGVFNGSGGTGIRCEPLVNGADVFLYQQTYPDQVWGKQYLTAPLATKNSKNQLLFNQFRILVKDVNTVVKRNGVALTGLIDGRYYTFTSRNPEFIEADKPVMVAQYNTYFTSCGNDEYSDPGSNEGMFYLTPLGNGIKSSIFFTKTGSAPPFGGSVPPDYITIIIPDAGLASLKVSNSNVFDSVYAHPQKPGYSVVMKGWDAVDSVSLVESDYEFTAISHQPHNSGGYAYNVGFQVPRVKINSSNIKNVLNLNPSPNTYTCVGTSFRPTVYLPVQATKITWKLSSVAGITPSTDIIQNNPLPKDTVVINFKDYYGYTLAQDLRFGQIGTYNIPVVASYSGNAASCENTSDTGMVKVVVIAAPVIDYTYVYTGCINAAATFSGTGTAGNGAIVDRWNWNFGDNTASTIQNPVKTWNAAGNYNVSLQGIANDGCVNSVTKPIVVNALPTFTLVSNTQAICPGGSATFQILNPVTGATYSWFSTATGGTALATGTSFTATNIPAATTYYASAKQNGCDVAARVPATVTILPNVAAPVVTTDSIGTRQIRFRWNAVPNAISYQVSTDGGSTWIVPSSGSTGLTHLVTGLNPMQSVTIQVRSVGPCNQGVSSSVSAATLSEEVYIPNSFTPNGDGKNDIMMVYATGMRSLRFLIFNQWGQKVYEGNNPNGGWDGKYGGKDAPMGVYIYVATAVLYNGTEITKKGNINLIR